MTQSPFHTSNPLRGPQCRMGLEVEVEILANLESQQSLQLSSMNLGEIEKSEAKISLLHSPIHVLKVDNFCGPNLQEKFT
jgi:hypothetical protein